MAVLSHASLVRYAINDETSVKAAVTRNLQYIHLVSNSGTTLADRSVGAQHLYCKAAVKLALCSRSI